jgi:ribose 5-phosphate isomerase A
MGSDREALKRLAGERAVAEIEDGMVVGLGSGTTSAQAVLALGERVKAGLKIVGIPTSDAVEALARRAGVPLTSFAEHRRIDLAFDGADEVERATLNLIKGLGGALTREKIVARASKRFIVMVDDSKLVDQLGSRGPVPVEVLQFGWEATEEQLRMLDAAPRLRLDDRDRLFVTDNGNYIFDCSFGPLPDPARLADELNLIPGVVETGLFISMTGAVIVASDAGIEVLEGPTR